MLNTYTSYSRLGLLMAIVTFVVILISNYHAAMIFAGGVGVGIWIAITYKLADEAGEVKRK